MSEISRINKIVDQLASSLESIVKYSKFSYKDDDEENNGNNGNEDSDNDDSDNDVGYGMPQRRNTQQQTKEFEEITDLPLNDSAQGITIVHTNAMQLITGIQELLLITRSLRERWVIGQASSFLKYVDPSQEIQSAEKNEGGDAVQKDEMLDSLEQKSDILSKSIDQLLKR